MACLRCGNVSPRLCSLRRGASFCRAIIVRSKPLICQAFLRSLIDVTLRSALNTPEAVMTRATTPAPGRDAAVLGAALALSLGGCVPLLVADVASGAATGKTTDEHVLSAVTHKDCRVIEGIARADRKVCEEPGSPATEHDFKGIGHPGKDSEGTSRD